MCGINGIYAYNSPASEPSTKELIATRDYMQSRGPDGKGEWWSEDKRMALGHRRLSIIDLSDRASQPMVSECGRFIAVFNGEIYNYPALRHHLETQGAVFRTSSDTEVLLHLFAHKGEAMVHDLRGMFAFAIWDNRTRTLFLARDPFGIKPLYISDDGSTFRFASQVKALLAGGEVSRDHDPAGVVGFFLWGSVPEPFTFYKSVGSLPAGHTLKVEGKVINEPQPYVSLAAEMARAAKEAAAISDLPRIIREAASDSVRAHMLADVDVGLFLSAGIDSGALLGLMMDSGASRVRTITVGFDSFAGTHDDEVPLASQVARRYGARHTVRRVSQREFEDDLPAILNAMDQPSIDGVNTWFVAKAACEAGLKVALSGLGGDELLAGYPGFAEIPRMVRTFAPFGRAPFMGTTARHLIEALGLARQRPKLAGLVEYGGSFEGAYLLRRGLFLPSELPRILGHDLTEEGLARLDAIGLLRASLTPDPGSNVGRVAALECGAYTRNTLLRDTDWAGMAHSLEIRTPLLDIGFLRQVAPAMPSICGRAGKRALATAPAWPLPESVANRAKSGFAVPTGQWMADAAATRRKPAGRVGRKGLASRGWARAVFAAHAEPGCDALPICAKRRDS
jgi:asparagine synthase (glutamine-hydrolysing)